MRVCLLGTLQAETDAGAVVNAGGVKQRSVLAQLCRWPNQAVGVDRLAEGVWGETVPPRYRQNLQVYVSTLRRALEPERPAEAPSRIVGHGDAYELVAAPDEIDVSTFERRCAEGFAALDDGRPGAAAELLRDALALWRGEPLVELAHQPFAGDWIDELSARRLLALERRIDADLARGLHGELVIELEQLLAAHPEREHLWEQLVTALYRGGRQQEALEAYRRALRLLDDLGLEPAPRLRDLAGQVLRQDVELLGSPPRSRQQAIPLPLTPALGRAGAVDELVATIRDGARLLALVGPGGVGKTRLALTAAHALDEAGSSIAWVPLADEHAAERIEPVVAQALGAEGEHGLGESLAGGARVLFLDNLEQIDGAGAVIVRWLEAAPELQVVVTSRSPLGVPGERLMPVRSLEPAVAIQLFVERAEAALPDFDAARHADDVRALCEHLDRLPLALELAAARIATFAPRDLIEQIAWLGDDRPEGERHGSLRALVGWSTDLLDKSAQSLFAELAVCDGSFDLDAAAALAEPLGLERPAVGRAVAAIVRAGLVTPIETDAGRRFTLLRTIRAVALDRLGRAGSERALTSLSALLVARSRATDPLEHADRARLAAAEADLALTRQVIAFLTRSGRAAEAAEIVLAQRKALAMLGRSDETLMAARSLFAAELAEPLRARISVVAGGCAYVAAAPDVDELLAALDDLPEDDAVYRVHGHAWLCALSADRDEHEVAQRHAAAGIELATAAGSPRLEWLARSAAAWAALLRDDAADAGEHARRQLELAATDSEVAYSLVDIARAELLQGNVDSAERYARDAVVAARRLGPSRTLGEALRYLATTALLRGDDATAANLFAEAARGAAGDSDELGLLELVASIGIAAAAGGRLAEGASLVQTATALAQRTVPGASAVPSELADLAERLALADAAGAARVSSTETINELLERALQCAGAEARAPLPSA